jgi:hypothetical protein
LGKKMKKLGDGLLLGLRRGRGEEDGGEARRRCPPVILRRTPARVVVDLMGKMCFSSIVELEKKKRGEELLRVERKALGGEGRVAG